MTMNHDEIRELVLAAMRNMNLARTPESQLDCSPTAAIFGPGSPLDSLGLVSLLIDIEDALFARGHAITISDERAVSQKHSPFRGVPSLVSYISSLLPCA